MQLLVPFGYQLLECSLQTHVWERFQIQSWLWFPSAARLGFSLGKSLLTQLHKHTIFREFSVKKKKKNEWTYLLLFEKIYLMLQVGDENGKAKTAPMKLKVQFMLQVPQDDIKSSALMFRVKKRWDI